MTLTAEQQEALVVARNLAEAGIPIFVATPDETHTTGFKLPQGWQKTQANPAVVDAWKPGYALCLLTGLGIDLLDVDLHNGGDPKALGLDALPDSYGAAYTPSGGVHSFIASLGVRSRDNVVTGIDIKAGQADGKGRGFAFIAPTVKISKTTGELASYRWAQTPEINRIRSLREGALTDASGAPLAELIRAKRRNSRGNNNGDKPRTDGPDYDALDAETAAVVDRWVTGALQAIKRDLTETADWKAGQRDGEGRGWEKLQADAALRLGQLARARWNSLTLGEAEEAFLDAAPTDETWSDEDVASKWRSQSGRRDPASWPGLRSASDRETASWGALGLKPVAGSAGSNEGSTVDAANPKRYFGEGGLQADILGADVLNQGPIAVGLDDITWVYEGGVWSPARYAVRDRVVRLLGARHRPGHTSVANDVVRTFAPFISCDPLPDYVNFKNGLLDLDSGELLPHAPDIHSTVQLGVDYVPDAQCPDFEKFLLEVLPADMIDTVWELIGYLMFSGNPLHKAVMLTGTGRNGKGTFLRVLLDLLGRRNVAAVSLHDLTSTRFSTASLFGKLANIAGDIDAGYIENTATFKAVTGGDQISAEHKGRDRFDFTPWAVPVFSANKIPASADTTTGYLSRWVVVPFPNSFDGREDRTIDKRLRQPAELEGIAARSMAALPGLLKRGNFPITESSQVAAEEFARRVDQVRTWAADCCDIADEHPFTPRTPLYEAYKRWAARDGHRPVRSNEFYDRIEAVGAVPIKLHGIRGFARIKLIDDAWGSEFNPPNSAIGAGEKRGIEASYPQGNWGQIPAFAPAPKPAPKQVFERRYPQESVDNSSFEPRLEVGTCPQLPPTCPQNSDCNSSQNAEKGAKCPKTTCPQNSNCNSSQNTELGAEGAGKSNSFQSRIETVCKDIKRGEIERGRDLPAPPAPKHMFECSPEGGLSTGKATRSETRKVERQARIVAASGASYELPAVVSRDGTVSACSISEAEQKLASIDALTVDVEHTGYPVGHNAYRLKTIQLGCEDFALVFDAEDSQQTPVVRTALAAASILHAHSATADLVPLAVAGLVDHDEAWTRMADTVLDAKLSDPASTGSDPGLKKLAEAVLGDSATAPAADAARAELFKAGKWLTNVKTETPIERSGWAQADVRSETMIRYAASDVLDTAALANKLPHAPPHVIARERLTQRMTARVAYRGLRLDGDHVDELYRQQETALADAAARLAEFGVENPGSDQQVAAAVERQGVRLPRTATGRPSVARAGIEAHAEAEGPLGALVRARLDYQTAENRIGLFLENYRQLVRYGDGRARPTVYTLGADTGRMSCRRPNAQQIPRAGGYRACLTADPGHVLISADFASVELRVAAALSGDENLRAIVADPARDVHREVAQIAFGPSAGKAERYMAKRGVFGRIYGGGRGAIARGVGVSEAVAQQIIDALDQMLPQLAEWSRLVRDATQAGRTQFETYAGRVIHLDRDLPHKAPNFCIQGTARELLVDALVAWQATRWGDATLLPVHDELLVMVPESDAAEATAALTAAMTNDLHGVQIVAEASAPAPAWQDSV